jgi:hypothetical protein
VIRIDPHVPIHARINTHMATGAITACPHVCYASV